MKFALTFFALFTLAIIFEGNAQAQKAVSEADFVAAKEMNQIKLEAAKESLQKDTQALATRVDNQDKRIDQQNGRFGDLGHSIGLLGWLSAGVGVLITLIGFVTGLVGYFSVKSKAKTEAEEAAKSWFEQNEKSLKSRLDELHKRCNEIENQVTKHASESIAQISDTTATVEKAKKTFEKGLEPKEKAVQPATGEERISAEAVLADAVHNMNAKSEEQYTYDDWEALAFVAYSSGRFDEAIRCWRKVSQSLANPPFRVGRALFNTGSTLNQQGHDEGAIAEYDLVVKRLGKATDTPSTGLVVDALFNKALTMQKLQRFESVIAAYDLLYHHVLGASFITNGMLTLVSQSLVNKAAVQIGLHRLNDAIATTNQLTAHFESSQNTACITAVAMSTVNLAQALVISGRYLEAVSAIDIIKRRYATIETADFLTQISKANDFKCFALICNAKSRWSNTAELSSALQIAKVAVDEALLTTRDKSRILVKQSYCAHLARKSIADVQAMLHIALHTATESVYLAEIEDLAIHPVPPDEIFKKLLHEEWTRPLTR